MRFTKPINYFVFFIMALPLTAPARAELATLASPDGQTEFKVTLDQGRLGFAVSARGAAVIAPSPLVMALDGVTTLTDGARLDKLERYQDHQTFKVNGVHAQADAAANGARLALTHLKSQTPYTLDLRAYNDGVAFQFVVPGSKTKKRVPDESTVFNLPAGSTVWFHGLRGHYEGAYDRKSLAEVQAGEWAAPPLTFKLPGGVYASLTEANLVHYAGMALQANGRGGFTLALGHKHPASYPFTLRYGEPEAQRLALPAAIAGTIATPWRVVLIGDLNALVNSDIVPALNPPPDPELFPQGPQTDWVKPGRAVWEYLDGKKSTLDEMKEYCRLAGQLGFEHNVLEGFWRRWSDSEMQDLLKIARENHVDIWIWRHSKELRDLATRREFLRKCHDLGVAGVKIDFLDHEAKEIIDVYQMLLSETAEYHLMVNFHGSNKPTGESRTWPNELTREAVKGMESSKFKERARHETTLPFTRLLAGPADYTPVHFGERRADTTWAHQIASAAILTSPLLTYAASPRHLLENPAVEMIKAIPAVWDETRVLAPSEIGDVAVFARRRGAAWFLAVMNGPAARTIEVPLSFLGQGELKTLIVRDRPGDPAAVDLENKTSKNSDTLKLALPAGGGHIARFTK